MLTPSNPSPNPSPGGWGTSPPAAGGVPHLLPGSMGALLMELAPFESVMPLLAMMPGLGLAQFTLDDAVVYILQALDWIGNRYAVRYVVQLYPDVDGRVDLPDNCNSVDAVVAGSLDCERGRAASTLPERLWAASQVFRRGDAVVSYPDTPAFQGDIWGRPIAAQLVPEPGVGVHLKVAAGTASILVSYRARYVDDRNWPLITPKQAFACASYIRYIQVSNKFFAQELPENIFEQAQRNWEQAMGLARNEGLGDKQGVARLRDEKASYHRHSYGSRIKL